MKEHLDEMESKIYDLKIMSRSLLILGENTKDDDMRTLFFLNRACPSSRCGRPVEAPAVL